ncbi:MAG: hypothetical protein ACC634_11330, partial [Hyphomicrobiales bacterium]
MTGVDTPDQHRMKTAMAAVTGKSGAGLWVRLAGWTLATMARVFTDVKTDPVTFSANDGPVVRLVIVEDLLMLTAATGQRGNVNLTLPADQTFDQLAGFLEAAKASVDRCTPPFAAKDGAITVPITLPGSDAARK